MKEYHVTLKIVDCVTVDADNKLEAMNIAIDIFKESGYDMSRAHEIETEEINSNE